MEYREFWLEKIKSDLEWTAARVGEPGCQARLDAKNQLEALAEIRAIAATVTKAEE